MSGGPRLKPPPLTSTGDDKPDDEHNSSYFQLKVLTEYMATEFLGMKPDKLANLPVQYETEAYPARIRELYDFVIAAIDSTTNAKMGRMKLDRMVNIFNAYSGITPEKRAFETATGVKAFKAVGEFHDDGSYRKYAKLTPAPTSPTVQTPFPPAGDLADARGIVSYVPNARRGRDYTMAQAQADSY